MMRTIIVAFATVFAFLGWEVAVSGSMLTKLESKMIEYGITHEVTYEECHREAQRIANQYEEKDFELYFHGDGVTLFKIISRDGDKYRISCDRELTMRIIKFTGDLFSGL